MAYTTVDDPKIYFNTLLYTGNGSTSHSITGVGFQPDFVWIKRRDAVAGHKLNDAVRGVNKQLVSNNSNAEDSNTDILTAFGTNGFTLGNNSDVNNGSGTFVSWNWKAGGSASSNSNGSITSSVSASTDAGFSIVKWSGNGSASTIGHGLGSAPSCIITKSLGGTTSWGFYHQSLGNTKILFFNETGTGGTHIAYWNNTSPTSSVFTVGSDSAVNHSGNDMIAYVFAEKKGYSKFGSYTGNGNADGPFVYTGFKPALVIRKVTSASSDWLIQDNKRSESGGFNQIRNYLFPNSTQAEVSNQDYFNIDFLSNGFKMRSTDGGANGSGSSYIYMAFSESPFTNSSGVPNNAR